mmetsp:Transcript_50405/g.133188  ORF Transcript_50405/g.133188 Transcript_50405/m.133188 type:complete len:86 (+) Transcript_50405:1132-1389(+)
MHVLCHLHLQMVRVESSASKCHGKGPLVALIICAVLLTVSAQLSLFSSCIEDHGFNGPAVPLPPRPSNSNAASSPPRGRNRYKLQ